MGSFLIKPLKRSSRKYRKILSWWYALPESEYKTAAIVRAFRVTRYTYTRPLPFGSIKDVSYKANWKISTAKDHEITGRSTGILDLLSIDDGRYWESDQTNLTSYPTITIKFNKKYSIAFIALQSVEEGDYCPQTISMHWSPDLEVAPRILINTDSMQYIQEQVLVRTNKIIIGIRDTFGNRRNELMNVKLRHLRVFAYF